MAISAKGKRRISVNGRAYLWHIFDEYDQGAFDGVQIMVAAVDKALFLRYGLHQPDTSRTALILPGPGAPTMRAACPRFEGEDQVMTPRGVCKLIDWAFAELQ